MAVVGGCNLVGIGVPREQSMVVVLRRQLRQHGAGRTLFTLRDYADYRDIPELVRRRCRQERPDVLIIIPRQFNFRMDYGAALASRAPRGVRALVARAYERQGSRIAADAVARPAMATEGWAPPPGGVTLRYRAAFHLLRLAQFFCPARAVVQPADYEQVIASALNGLRGTPTRAVLCTSTPLAPWRQPGSLAMMDDLRDRLRRLAIERGSLFCDVHAALLRAGTSRSLQRGGLYPSALGHQLAAQAMAAAVLQALATQAHPPTARGR